MDVHPPKNGMYRYWSIATSVLHRILWKGTMKRGKNCWDSQILPSYSSAKSHCCQMHKQPPATKPSCKCLFQASQQMQQISSAVSHLGSVLSASAIYCPGTGACVATSHKQRYDCAGTSGSLGPLGTAWDRLGPLELRSTVEKSGKGRTP